MAVSGNTIIPAAVWPRLLLVDLSKAWYEAYGGPGKPCSRKPRKNSRRAYWASGRAGQGSLLSKVAGGFHSIARR